MCGDRRLEGKVAIVTGAAGAIGGAEALALAKMGASVVVNDVRDAEETARIIRTDGGAAEVCVENVATQGAGERIVACALRTFGRLDILINNAGIGRRAAITEATEADWDEVVAVNLKGAFATIRAAAPIFCAQRSGVIVNTSSDAGTGTFGFASYAASKEGLVGLTRAAAWELGRSGVVTFAIRPRAFDGPSAPPDKHRAFKLFEQRAGVPMVGTHPWAHTIFPRAEEVGAVVAWLCAEAPRALNGRVLQVGGGEIGLWDEPAVGRSFVRATPWDGFHLDAIRDELTAGLCDPRDKFTDELWTELTTRQTPRPKGAD